MKIFFKIVSGFAIIAIVVGVIGLYLLRWTRSPFDDGPFMGMEYSENISVMPDSKVDLGRFIIEAYNKVSEEAPVIVLRDKDGEIIWKKLVVVSNTKNYENCKVMELKLYRGKKTIAGYHIKGVAYWTFGHEAANFYLDKNGNLKEFYLSW